MSATLPLVGSTSGEQTEVANPSTGDAAFAVAQTGADAVAEAMDRARAASPR